MADYTNSKTGPRVYPEQALETPWGRLEPLITPDRFVAKFLWGLKLQSKYLNPLTGLPWTLNEADIKDLVNDSVNIAEIDLGLTIMPVQYETKMPYDRKDYIQYGYFQLPNKPISSIERLSMKFSDNTENFVIPNSWIEVSNLVYGQVNLVPVVANALATDNNNSTFNSMLFLNLWDRSWVPALMDFVYTAGFSDGLVPSVINEYIGTITAIDILSKLGATYAEHTSTSLSLDGGSQSLSGPGPNIYVVRIGDLEKKRDKLSARIQKIYRRMVIKAI